LIKCTDEGVKLAQIAVCLIEKLCHIISFWSKMKACPFNNLPA
jgi:hypothetical protein